MFHSIVKWATYARFLGKPLSGLLEQIGEGEIDHLGLRQRVVTYVRLHRDDYKEFHVA